MAKDKKWWKNDIDKGEENQSRKIDKTMVFWFLQYYLYYSAAELRVLYSSS